MDPVSSIGLTAAVLQFVEFTYEIVIGSIELGQLAIGLSNAHGEIQNAGTRLLNLNNKIRDS